MGIRAHVQVKHPEYGNACLSSWVDAQFSSFLTDNDIHFYSGENDASDHWEIDVDDNLRDLVRRLEADPSIFDATLGDELKDCGYGEQVSALLREGIAAADKNKYWTIAIDWF